MEREVKERLQKILSKRTSIIVVILLTFFTLVAFANTLSISSKNDDTKPVQVQGIPFNEQYKGFPQLPKELIVKEGDKIYKINFYRWGFILYSKDLSEALNGNAKEGYIWFSSWKFKFTQLTQRSGHLEYVSFSRPTPDSIGESIYGTLPPEKYDEYGGFYETAGAHISVSITWSPADNPIVISTYCLETGRGQGYVIAGGSWTGTLEVLDSGTNFVVVANPNQVEITYSGSLIWP